MISFDPLDPYPLLSLNSHSYAEAQEHSATVDSWLGLRTYETETELRSKQTRQADQQLWIGLPVKSLLTPYTEIRQILEQLSPESGTTIVDLGAGYGRMGFVIGRQFPGVGFHGYEYVAERVDEANRCLARLRYENIVMERADISAPGFSPMIAKYYFLYDYGTREAIEKTLQDLRFIASSRAITVVGRGRASRDAIERDHPWLSQVNRPRHFSHYSIYRS